MNFNNAKFDCAYGVSAQLPESTAKEIVFAGRSNVGKSSLLNRLFGRKGLARVSSVPGKTITINFYDVDGFRFVDLPGYGYAKISRSEKERFAELMEGYFAQSRNISLVLLLIDMRRPPSADDMQMIEFLKSKGLDFAAVLTKSDKLNKTQFAERLKKAALELGGDCAAIPFSALNSNGVEEIRRLIENKLSDNREDM